MNKVHRRVLYKNKIKRIPRLISGLNDIYYITASESKLVNKHEIEAARVVISKELRKRKEVGKSKGKFWVLLNFKLPYTKKSSHSRMGKGKGLIDSYKSYISINEVIFKFENLTLESVFNLFKLVSSKLSFAISLYNGESIQIESNY